MRRGVQTMGWGLVAALVLTVASAAGAANIWVVDGSTFPPHFAFIQAAIDFASPGDTIVVSTAGGPYAQVLINKDNLAVVGEGDTEINDCDSPGAHAVVIQASGARFQGFHLTNDLCSGILVTGSDNWVVANWVDDPDGRGIRIEGSDARRNTILGNWVTSAGAHGISDEDGGGGGNLYTYNVVSNTESDPGIKIVALKDTVDYNVSVFNDEQGIKIGSDAADQFKVTNNIALDNGQRNKTDFADLSRASGATGTFKKNVFGTCQIDEASSPFPACPAF